MALPHRAMGRKAAQILLAEDRAPVEVKKIPFRLVERLSV
jgi:DNA-binding LacI/PurR family transcriptional regulator